MDEHIKFLFFIVCLFGWIFFSKEAGADEEAVFALVFSPSSLFLLCVRDEWCAMAVGFEVGGVQWW